MPFVFATSMTTPILSEVVSNPIKPENIAVNAPQEVVEDIKNPYCNCVESVRLLYPEAPYMMAKDYPRNGTEATGEVLLLKYDDSDHVAPYKVGTSTLQIHDEGNYKECEKTDREIEKDNERIVGYFDYDLWLEIQKLSPTLQNIIKCESNFHHYNSDGGVIKGDAGEYGLIQIKRKTWNWFNDLRVKQGLEPLYDILDPYLEIEMLKWAEQNPPLLNHWSCYNKINETSM